jgi:hypothetical protein
LLVIHLRVIAPPALAGSAVACLTRSVAVTSVVHVVHLSGAATKPSGDLILADPHISLPTRQHLEKDPFWHIGTQL